MMKNILGFVVGDREEEELLREGVIDAEPEKEPVVEEESAALIVLRTLLRETEDGNFAALEKGFFYERLAEENRSLRIA